MSPVSIHAKAKGKNGLETGPPALEFGKKFYQGLWMETFSPKERDKGGNKDKGRACIDWGKDRVQGGDAK